MNENIRKYGKEHLLLSVFAALFCSIPAIVYFSTLSLTRTQLYYTETYLPALLGAAMCLPILFWIANFCFFRKKALGVVALVVGLLFSLGEFLFLAYCLSKLTYFFMAGAPYFIVIGLIGLLVLFFLCGAIKRPLRIALGVVFAAVIAAVSVFGVFRLLPVSFSSGAVVFAVEDEYQIAWCTSTNTTGYVTIGDTVYVDSVAGEMNVSRVHKVRVDRNALENEKQYTVHATNILNKRAYLTLTSSKISHTYAFRPVDASDGMQIYNVSDNHLLNAGAIKAGGYWGDKLDLVIANGDHVNDVSAEWQMENVYKLLSSISQSSRPVIITRGNHEAVGTRLKDLPYWYGSREGTFYYTVRFADTLFVVLDIANDMKDDASTISATAAFDEYREKEVEWLTALQESGIATDPQIRHVIGVCHIAFPLNIERYHGKTSGRMLDLTESMDMELLLCGHSHRIAFFDADSGENAATYPVVLGSIRNNKDLSHESVSAYRFTGTAVEIKENITLLFTDEKHEVKDKRVIPAKQ